MVVDSMVRHWLPMKVEDNSIIHNGLVHALGRSLGVFYAVDGLIWSQDPEWFQGVLNRFIGLFLRIFLMANVTKYKTMACQPGAI